MTKEYLVEKLGRISKTSFKLGLCSGTRAHEPGMASNRRSAYYGETVPNPCTYRPSHDQNSEGFKEGLQSYGVYLFSYGRLL